MLNQPSNAHISRLLNEPLMMSFEAELTELFTQLCFDPLHFALGGRGPWLASTIYEEQKLFSKYLLYCILLMQIYIE